MVPDGADGSVVPEAGAQAALRYGWGTLRARTRPLLVVAAGLVLVEAVLGSVGPALDMIGAATATVTTIELFLSLVVSAPVGAAFALACLEATRGNDPELGDLLAGYDRFVDVVLAAAIVAVAVGIGLLLLIIPGIYIGLRLAFAPLMVLDQEMGPWEAVQESGDRTGGEILGLFVLLLATIVILVVGLLLFLVGVVPAVAWVGTSWAGYYRSLVEGPTGEGAGGAASEVPAGA